MKNIENELFVIDTYSKTRQVMDKHKDKNVIVAYSGGSDSDTIMFIMKRLGYNINSVMYDTGLEYEATWNQIEKMSSIGWNIDIIKPNSTIPLSIRNYGYPFISKKVSDMLNRLQKHGFNFKEDGLLSLDELYPRFPKAKAALRWWTNDFSYKAGNISWNKYLKEFLVEKGLPFRVSKMCCEKVKKQPALKYAKDNNVELFIMGIRKSEGGVRSSAYKNCYHQSKTQQYNSFFPIFWWSNEEKKMYDDAMGVVHSDCYEVYGLKRTGCAGCPYNIKFEDELKIIDKYEPSLSKGINNIFKESYDWTRLYREFVQDCKIQKQSQ